MIVEGNKITPEEGYMYVTNGETYSTLVYLGKYDSPDNWHDTNDEPPTEEDATEEDYQEQLRRYGAEV